MTTTGDFSAAATITAVPALGPPPPHGPRRSASTSVVAGLVVALVAAAAGVAYVAMGRDDAPVDTRPVVLPETFAGLRPAEASAQFAQVDDQWRDRLADAYDGHPFDGRAYGATADRVRINVVVSRGDFPDVGDASFGRPPFADYGPVSCTHTLQLPESDFDPDPQPVLMPRIFVCMRHDDVATVSAFALLGADGLEPEVAAAVDQVWALQQ